MSSSRFSGTTVRRNHRDLPRAWTGSKGRPDGLDRPVGIGGERSASSGMTNSPDGGWSKLLNDNNIRRVFCRTELPWSPPITKWSSNLLKVGPIICSDDGVILFTYSMYLLMVSESGILAAWRLRSCVGFSISSSLSHSIFGLWGPQLPMVCVRNTLLVCTGGTMVGILLSPGAWLYGEGHHSITRYVGMPSPDAVKR